MRNPGTLRAVRIALAAWVAIGVLGAAPAFAAEARSQTHRFDIPAQKLDDALQALAFASQHKLLYSAKLVEGLNSPPLKGEFTTEEAVRKILSGTGLDYQVTADGLVVIKAPKTAVLKDQTARLETNAMQQVEPLPAGAGESTVPLVRSGGSAQGQTESEVSGKVTDVITGSYLKAAQVILREAGRATSTDELGGYRFASVQPGTYTLEVSYLGYAQSSARIEVRSGENLAADFPLTGAGELVVYGSRSARAQALNQQRTAENVSTVVSADLLGDFPGTTVSEALRRVPGVTFQQDPLTGDGTNIIIRGLAPDLNQVRLNGVRLPEGSGVGRSPSLNNLLADSIDSVTISKTLLANQDSAGTGGLVEIETRSPLDGPRRRANFALESGRRSDDFGQDFLASGTLSGRFGERGHLGLGLSLQYRDRTIDSIHYSTDLSYGQYLPLEADGSTSIFGLGDIDPRRRFPFESGAALAYPLSSSMSRDSTSSRDLSITATGAWQIGGHTDLRLDYVRATTSADTFHRDASMNLLTSYSEQPVAALGGELRQALAWDGAAFVRQSYQSSALENDTDTVSFRGSTESGAWRAGYNFGYARGRSTAPDNRTFSVLFGTGTAAAFGTPVDPSLLSPEAVDPIEGRILSAFAARSGRGVPLPLLTEAGWAVFNDPGNYFMGSGGSRGSNGGENTRYSGDLSLHRDFQSRRLRYIEAGLSYESSKFSTHVDAESIRVLPLACDPGDFLCMIFPTYPSAGDFGLQFTQSDLGAIGQPGQGFYVLSRRSFDSFWRGADANPLVSISPFALDPRYNRQYTREDNPVAYLQARFDVGRLETIAGARLDRVDVTAVNLIQPTIIDENGEALPDVEAQLAMLREQSAAQDVLLPRAQLNYRFSHDVVLRGAYFQSVARPAIADLSTDVQLSLDMSPFAGGGPNFDQPLLQLFQGNPGLKPAITHSYDLSLGWYFENVGALSIGLFYKEIDNELGTQLTEETDNLDEIDLPDHPIFQDLPANLVVYASRPVNSPNAASIWGVELAGEYQFTGLPGAWSGLGMFANYTYTDSERTQQWYWSGSPVFDSDGAFAGREPLEVSMPRTPFAQQPPHSGTAAVTYNKLGIDATLAWTYQSRRRSFYQPHGLVSFDESADSLDLHVQYRFDRGAMRFRVYLEGLDLMDGPTEASIETSRGGEDGVPAWFTGGSFLGGRSLRLGFAASY